MSWQRRRWYSVATESFCNDAALGRVGGYFMRRRGRQGGEHQNCSDEELREELNSGRIDLAFLLTDGFALKAVNVKRLKTEALALVCGPDHPLARHPDRSPDRLAGHTLLLPKTD